MPGFNYYNPGAHTFGAQANILNILKVKVAIIQHYMWHIVQQVLLFMALIPRYSVWCTHWTQSLGMRLRLKTVKINTALVYQANLLSLP